MSLSNAIVGFIDRMLLRKETTAQQAGANKYDLLLKSRDSDVVADIKTGYTLKKYDETMRNVDDDMPPAPDEGVSREEATDRILFWIGTVLILGVAVIHQ